MVERFKNHDDCEMLILKNKNPQWNEGNICEHIFHPQLTMKSRFPILCIEFQRTGNGSQC